MNTRLALCLLPVAVGCESNASKYERLQAELATAESPLGIAERAAAEGRPQCPELANLPTNAYLAACTDSLAKARTRVALLQRDMNKFMNGR